MFTTIVWATDGSPSADHALPYAKALAAVENGKLLAVHADENSVWPACAYPVLADEDAITAKIRDQVVEIREEGLDASVSIVPAAAPGAAHMIAEVARKVVRDGLHGRIPTLDGGHFGHHPTIENGESGVARTSGSDPGHS